jgi:NitT/TauT family transport system ATP-binding protein
VKVIDSPLPAERSLAIRDTPAFLQLAADVREALVEGHHDH